MRITDYYQLKADLLHPSAESVVRDQKRRASRTEEVEIVEDLLTEVVILRKQMENLRQGLMEQSEQTEAEELRSQLLKIKDELISSKEEALALRYRLLHAEEDVLELRRENLRMKTALGE